MNVVSLNHKRWEFFQSQKLLDWNFFFCFKQIIINSRLECWVIALIESGIEKLQRKIESFENFLPVSQENNKKNPLKLWLLSRQIFPRFSLNFSLSKLLFSLSCCYRVSGYAITLKTWCWASRYSAAQPDGPFYCFLKLKISANKKDCVRLWKN